MSINDGGPAFPGYTMNDDGETVEVTKLSPGMSLRHWYAGKALASMLSSETCQSQLEKAIRDRTKNNPEEDRRKMAREIIAKRSFDQADAMLAEDAKSTPSDISEMARTIQRLERGIEKAMAICAQYCGQEALDRVRRTLSFALSKDTEADR